MKLELNVRVTPEIASNPDHLLQFVSKQNKIPKQDIKHIECTSRSIDARQKHVVYQLRLDVYINEEFIPFQYSIPDFQNVKLEEPILIIGAGPAGLFAALRALELGKKPIILERGKNVKVRVSDLRGINVHHIVNEDSNYCFGEGGAGTYSDGKLYTRSKKRGNIRKVLEYLVSFGATKQILVDAHPHIGTNKLPKIIQSIRECILSAGGEIHFHTRVTDLIMNGNSITGVKSADGHKWMANKVIIATGHSGREIFQLLHEKGIEIHTKPLAIGVRVEHPQSLIDSIQYHCQTKNPLLPASEYSLVKQINGRGVYSFCMCPGGVIAPCATKPGEVVTNGWSSAERSRPTANSGIVVELRLDDFKSFESFGVFSALQYQSSIEQKAFLINGGTQKAPAQRMVDFTKNIVSTDLPKTSYTPGLVSVSLSEVLPPLIVDALQKGFKEFDSSMKGYFTNEAILHAPETRTSSPIQIPRNPETLEHITTHGLYPCGEGAGYAGGIVSAAIDGMKCAEAALTGQFTK
ncbi:NAD(P)/FAD-dependent oxidoreductase [Leptospira levettii]|uniref:NAD(P)/FAD-dependent oxidoreductase n=1 Tax=Leptospira levettii TaxID=2023178 RepID=A0AAW5UYI6_9LEPT|nr:NAD(P)/FAD-dependent oxidoreductase [Leptospira levettii]MCW7465102.1 NAD(P)/FAD-dependent oxidoreductase [Leptospira levettii]MCW7509842.1 NAD(P)/FAD-dependent oxidoreductase [Leptospira levettii]MCW7513592.1 NAD(P)/FAD-dependent oxidoreductase [Leptospira levettii]TGM92664.1 FAD-binding protein [Leptospira levettii]